MANRLQFKYRKDDGSTYLRKKWILYITVAFEKLREGILSLRKVQDKYGTVDYAILAQLL